jgi:hypothetical protein
MKTEKALLRIVTSFFAFAIFAAGTSFAQRSTPPASRARVEGTVVDNATNRPVAGVTINILQESDRQTVTTDAQGRFTFTSPHGTVRLMTQKDGYTSIQPRGHRKPARNGVLFTLRSGQQLRGILLPVAPAGSISGRVFDARSKPVQYAKAQLWQNTYDEEGRLFLGPVDPPAVAETNDRGEFRIQAVDPGEYYLHIGSPLLSERSPGESWHSVFYPGTVDSRRAQTVAVKPGGEVTVDDITMPSARGGMIRIRLTNKTGESLQSSLLKYLHWLQRDSSGDRVMVPLLVMGGPDRAEIPVPQGTYEVIGGWVRANGTPIGFGTAIVEVAQRPVDVEIVVVKPPRVAGRVLLTDTARRSSRPAADARCELNSDALGSFPATSGTDGSFTTNAAPPGVYDVKCSGFPADTYITEIPDSVQLSADTDTNIAITLSRPGSVIEGTVTDGKGDKAAAAIVVLVPDAATSASHLYRTIETDQNGAFMISGVAPGSYRLLAWTEIDENAYRNAEFMKKIEGGGSPLTVTAGAKAAVDLKLIEN